MSQDLSYSIAAIVVVASGIGYCVGRLHQLHKAEQAATHGYHAYRQVLAQLRKVSASRQ